MILHFDSGGRLDPSKRRRQDALAIESVSRNLGSISEPTVEIGPYLADEPARPASQRPRSLPVLVELAERLVRMFSFAGDTVLDPFLGTDSTTVVAAICGRNSIDVFLPDALTP